MKLLNVETNEIVFDGDDIEEFSDGCHTFNDLYNQRLYLFATIVNLFPEKSYKTKCDEFGNAWFDNTGWFLVSINTPEGDYSYHYKMEYWDLFQCKELDKSNHFDGHTSKDVSRLLSLVPKHHVRKGVTLKLNMHL